MSKHIDADGRIWEVVFTTPGWVRPERALMPNESSSPTAASSGS